MVSGTPRCLDVVEVAALVRRTLKVSFPGVRFSVRSNRYASGTASIHVVWKGGPPESDVTAAVEQYAGARADGDYSPRPIYHFLRPDGRAMVAHNPPSSAIGASEPEGEDNRALGPLMSPEVQLVRFGADFVLCFREPSDPEAAEIRRQFEEAAANRDPDELPF